jgi:hypothetical protein
MLRSINPANLHQRLVFVETMLVGLCEFIFATNDLGQIGEFGCVAVIETNFQCCQRRSPK